MEQQYGYVDFGTLDGVSFQFDDFLWVGNSFRLPMASRSPWVVTSTDASSFQNTFGRRTAGQDVKGREPDGFRLILDLDTYVWRCESRIARCMPSDSRRPSSASTAKIASPNQGRSAQSVISFCPWGLLLTPSQILISQEPTQHKMLETASGSR